MRIGQDGLSHRLEALIEKLPEEKRSPLRELLLNLLEPALAQRESLARLEEKYLLALKEDERDEKVVNIRRPEVPDSVPNPQRRWRLKAPCLIEAATYGELFRMAFELHLKSARSIFLSWHDIDPGSRQKPEVLLELSSCTIFIPDITRISLFEQESLLKVLRSPSDEKPLIMAGTHSPYSDLQCLTMLNKDFLSEVSQAYLKLTKPVAQYKREGLIRYFLESLV